jgi:hypothetical protein
MMDKESGQRLGSTFSWRENGRPPGSKEHQHVAYDIFDDPREGVRRKLSSSASAILKKTR